MPDRTRQAEVKVDRLQLRVSGLDPLDAERFAREVAAGLVPALRLAPGEASLSRLSVELQAKPGEQPDGLAKRTSIELASLINGVSATEAGR